MTGKAFFDEFNASLPVAEDIMGEDWIFNGAKWPSICIEDLDSSSSRMRGGRFRNATLTIDVRLAIAQQSGVTYNSLIEARGQKLRVLGLGSSGDDSVLMTCGPAGVQA